MLLGSDGPPGGCSKPEPQPLIPRGVARYLLRRDGVPSDGGHLHPFNLDAVAQHARVQGTWMHGEGPKPYGLAEEVTGDNCASVTGEKEKLRSPFFIPREFFLSPVEVVSRLVEVPSGGT